MCRVEVKRGHRDGLMYICFLHRAFAAKWQDSPCLKEVPNRLRSGAKRASAALYQGAFSLLLLSLLVGGCFDGERGKPASPRDAL